MTKNNKRFLDLSDEAHSEAEARAKILRRRWLRLCERYLPVGFEDSVWRFNRHNKPQEPSQGWKFHISATLLEACDLFERVAPFLISEDVQFKAPNSLDELSKLNCGLQYGYHQIGKFITIYPSTEKQALELAPQLHELTKDFFTVSVPFDEQYLSGSSVFYRYGGFEKIEATDENGNTFLAIRNSAGELVPDDRRRAVPEWLSNPFPNSGKPSEKTFADTPLGTTYRIFDAITQRGKGGTYQAFDFSQNEPRLCIVKEGRQNGELGWNGQDGYFLVQNEFEVLSVLKEKYKAVPQVFSSFEVYGNFYFAMEYVEGKSLREIMSARRRRFSVRQVLALAIEIAKIIEKIHEASWIWNDCKPANLIVTNDKSLRPIDFEGAYPANQPEPFDWKTEGFSKTSQPLSGKSGDLYALGAVIYFLLTGMLYDNESPTAIEKLRRNVSKRLTAIIEKLLSNTDSNISDIRKELEKILLSI
jgi:serine/threonine protein kinase